MSSVEIRIELPAYAHSFVIQIPFTSNVSDIKREISSSCIGRPRVEGQRIIWRGRYLLDHEKISELWNSGEPRIIHLAVHPSAWSSSPPRIPAPAQVPAPAFSTPFETPVVAYQNSPQPQMAPPSNSTPPALRTLHPLSYILFKHQLALSALSGDIVNQLSDLDVTTARVPAVKAVERHGWTWPTTLDEEFPAATEGGLRYKHITVDGNNFLSLVDPAAMPTPRQLHALQVLTYTFTLLSIPIYNNDATHTAPSQSVPIPPNVNLLLQQLGLPQVRVAQNQNPNPHRNQIAPVLREIPLRPLLAPLMMLVFRTLLLLYFVAPARKPIFGILILAWMLYEIWRPIHNGIVRGLRAAAAAENQRPQPRRNRAARQAEGVQNPQNAQNPPAEVPRVAQNAPGAIAGANFDLQAGAVLDGLANMNIAEEERTLSDATANAAEPSLTHKLRTLLSLLLTTTHPAIWNRRRVALRQREGRIRTEANLRDSASETEGNGDANSNRAQLRTELAEQYRHRPEWIREYMERVVAAEWVDDSD